MQKLSLVGKVHAGGFDLTEQTIKLLKEGFLDFTIDQQPYLQGFVPTIQLFFYKASNTQTGPFEANTGLKFVTKQTVEPYVAKSRYEGTTATAAVVK
jgi:simple sugar transport system substrate-binding protein